MLRHMHRRIAVGVVATLVASFAVMTSAAYAGTISVPTATPSSLTAGAATSYTIDFTASSSGALAPGVGTITLTGPATTQFPPLDTEYTVNGTQVALAPNVSVPGTVTITTPVQVNSSTAVAVVAGIGPTATNATAAGTYSISASTSSDPTPVASSPTYALVAGAASKDVVTGGGGQSATVGTAFTNALSATIEDSNGNPVLVSGSTVTFTAPASGASGTFTGGSTTDSTTTNASGVATTLPFTANTLSGAYSVIGSSAGASQATFSETNVAGAASQVVPTAGSGQSAAVGTAFATTLSATIEDSHGNPVLVPGTTVTFTAPGSGSSGTFVGGSNSYSTTTNSFGVATSTTFTAGPTPGTYSVGGASGILTTNNFIETDLTGPASQVVVTTGNTQSTPVGTLFATTLSATIEDSHGNPVLVPGTTVIFTAPGSGASGTFAGGGTSYSTTTSGSGVATATAFTANTKANSYAVIGSSSGLVSASFNLTNVAGAATQVVLTAGGGQSAVAGTAFATALSATIEDVHGNAVLAAGTTVTFSAPASGASGTFASNSSPTSGVQTTSGGVATATVFTANTTGGVYAMTVTSAGLTGASSNQTNEVQPGAPTSLIATLGNTSVVLSWSGPSSNGGSSITGYNIYEGTSSGGESANPVSAAYLTGCTSSSGPSGCEVTGLTNETTYYFNVRAVNVVGPSVASNGASATPASPWSDGYDLAAADGGVFTLGTTGFYGSQGGKPLTRPIVGVAATPDGGGYWEVASDGGVFTFGDAHYYGSEGGMPLTKPIVGMASTPDGRGYWLVASDGGVFTFGDAHFYGSEGGKPLTKPIVGMAGDATTGGYWLVASDGGIFSFNAPFAGSMGATHLSKPIVGMAADPVTGGYWEVASDGGIFAFDAGYYGSEGAKPLDAPIVGMAGDPVTGGYWEVASDGGIFSFNAPFEGSLGGTRLSQPIVGIATN
jgi:hypothetical protein